MLKFLVWAKKPPKRAAIQRRAQLFCGIHVVSVCNRMSHDRVEILRRDEKYITLDQMSGFIQIILNKENPMRILAEWNGQKYIAYENFQSSTILELEEYVLWCFAETIANALDCVNNDFLKYYAQIIIMQWLLQGRETRNNDGNALDLRIMSDENSGYSFHICFG